MTILFEVTELLKGKNLNDKQQQQILDIDWSHFDSNASTPQEVSARNGLINAFKTQGKMRSQTDLKYLLQFH